MSDQEISDDVLSPEEKAYFDNRGEASDAGGAPVVGADQPKNAEEEISPQHGEDGAQAPSDGAQKPAEKGSDESRKVDYRALREERERRYALEGQLAQMQRQFQVVDQRLAMMQQANVAQQQRPADPPSPEADVFASLQWTQNELAEMKRAEAERRRAEFEREQTSQYVNNLVQAWSNIAADTAKSEPDLPDAYNYLINQRKQELAASGLPPTQIEAQVRQDELIFVEQQMRANRHPAYAMMDIARARGWSPKQREAGQVPAAERLETVARGQEANRSMSGLGTSGASRGRVDTKALAEMTEDEFQAFLSKNGEKGFKAALSR